jgi:hypothetical protein
MFSSRTQGRGTWAALLASFLAPVGASAASAPDAGSPFEPPRLSPALYDVQPPGADPRRQQKVVRAADGVQLYVETWLPKARAGREPPPRLPTVLHLSPYLTKGNTTAYTAKVLEMLVSRGYAYSQAHVRGTGGSGGCIEQTGPNEPDDGARIVEYLGRDAPWASGSVGMYGQSYAGATQLAVAALDDPARTRYLKAIVPGAPAASWYDFMFQDGVPRTLNAVGNVAAYFLVDSLQPFTEATAPEQYVQRFACQPAQLSDAIDSDGDYTPYARERDLRRGVRNIRAAVLAYHGHPDIRVPSLMQAGLFERIPVSVPKAAVVGIFDHEPPDAIAFQQPPVQPDWRRQDWQRMLLAWYDRYLKGMSTTGVDDWPVVQVQGTDGQWRSEPEWPTTGGPVGHLGLGPGGLLGADAPSGSSEYVEGGPETTESEPPPGTRLVWETRPLADRLEITGQPALDLWVSVDRPDAHLAARLEAFDAAERHTIREARVVGLRSMRHLDPLFENRFVQPLGRDPATNTPIRVLLRFRPADLVVPRGGRLRLTLAGSLIVFDGLDGVTEGAGALAQGPSAPSGTATRVTVLHDCAHPSALRFLMARDSPRLLNVREPDEGEAPLQAVPASPVPRSDAGGLARAPLCGRAPERLPMFGPELPPDRMVGGCIDRISPRSARLRRRGRRVSRQKLRLRGTVRDRDCGERTGLPSELRSSAPRYGVKGVRVAVARVDRKRRCRYLRRRGRLGARRGCSRPPYLRARVRRSRRRPGVYVWSLRRRVRLPRGRYRVIVSAVDSRGNRERKRRVARFRVR